MTQKDEFRMIHIRLHPRERSFLEEFCKKEGRSMTEVMRSLVRGLQQKLEKSRKIR